MTIMYYSYYFYEFRNDAEKIIKQVKNGERMLLTYRGKPVVRFEPVSEQKITKDDPFYSLDKLADEHSEILANSNIDKILATRRGRLLTV